MEKVIIRVKGMHCESCGQLIRMALEDIGAGRVSANHRKGIVSVEYETTRTNVKEIRAAIEKEGYKVA